MSLWNISPVNRDKSVTEFQYWTRLKHQIVKEETYNWAEFQVNSDTEPVVDLQNEHGYNVTHDTNYSWSLSQLEQTRPNPTVTWNFPDNMSIESVDRLKDLIDQHGYLGLEADGWELTNTDFWLWKELTISSVTESEGE